MKKLQIAVLGCTGSIGMQTLDVIRMHADTMRLTALSIHKNIEDIKAICHEFQPEFIGISDQASAAKAKDWIGEGELIAGEECNRILAELPQIDAVVIAITGMVAIFPLLAAAKAGKSIALANKECIVCGGEWMREQLKQTTGIIHPVDSEQSAIYQCLQAIRNRDEVRRLLLTASGGPFREYSTEQMKAVTVEQALKHPNWKMGQKITIDSATLMNKGLEVIEAAYLFDVSPEQIDVFIHPQSIVHSMIETQDGSILAQLGSSDMRLPIQYALTYPHHISSPVTSLTVEKLANLNFFEPDTKRFPGLRLAYDALREGGTAPAIYNAANEVAVDRFLSREISFLDIANSVEETLMNVSARKPKNLEDILADDQQARRVAANL